MKISNVSVIYNNINSERRTSYCEKIFPVIWEYTFKCVCGVKLAVKDWLLGEAGGQKM